MASLESLPLLKVWLSPHHLVRTARQIMAAEQLDALPVLDEHGIHGIVRAGSLGEDDRELADFLIRPIAQAEISAKVAEAAEKVVQARSSCFVVTNQGRFLGLAHVYDLLKLLLQTDGESATLWSHRLREWALQKLEEGTEICVLAFDLWEFGMFNRRFGTEEGDRALETVYSVLAQETSLTTEVVARHSGDKFLVATTRTRSDAEALLGSLGAKIEAALVGKIKIRTGISGGFRVGVRPGTHQPSTVDDLIKLALQFSSATEQPKALVAAPINRSSSERISSYVQAVEIGGAPPAQARVRLFLEGGLVEGDYWATHANESALQIVAKASSEALRRAYPELKTTIERVEFYDKPDGKRIVSVEGILAKLDITHKLVGVSEVQGSVEEATAEAVLRGFEKTYSLLVAGKDSAR